MKYTTLLVSLFSPLIVLVNGQSNGVCNFSKKGYLWGAIDFGGAMDPVSDFCDEEEVQWVRDAADLAVKDVNEFYNAKFELYPPEDWDGNLRRLRGSRQMFEQAYLDPWLLAFYNRKRRLEEDKPQSHRALKRSVCPDAVNKFNDFFEQYLEVVYTKERQRFSGKCYKKLQKICDSQAGCNWKVHAEIDEEDDLFV